MKKFILGLMCIIMILGLTTGCGEKSIKKLMKERYDISSANETDRENFKADDDCGEDSYISATVKDKLFSKINFNVYEYTNYELEWCSTNYVDDFKDIMLNKYFDSFKDKNNISKEYKVRYILDNKYPLNEFKVLGTFNNRKELETLFDEILKFEEYVSKQKYNKFVIPFKFTKNDIFNYEIIGHGAEFYGYKDDIPTIKENKEILINDYLNEVLQNYDIEAMKDFTEDEIQEQLSKKNYTLGIKINDTYKYYDKYMLSSMGDISIGTLYYFLKELGYNVIGDQYDYTTTINNNNLSCKILPNPTCTINGNVIDKMISEYTNLINIKKLNDSLNLNICAKHKNGYVIE